MRRTGVGSQACWVWKGLVFCAALSETVVHLRWGFLTPKAIYISFEMVTCVQHLLFLSHFSSKCQAMPPRSWLSQYFSFLLQLLHSSHGENFLCILPLSLELLSLRILFLAALWSSVPVLPPLCPSVNPTLNTWDKVPYRMAREGSVVFAKSVRNIQNTLDCSYPGQGDTCWTVGGWHGGVSLCQHWKAEAAVTWRLSWST